MAKKTKRLSEMNESEIRAHIKELRRNIRFALQASQEHRDALTNLIMQGAKSELIDDRHVRSLILFEVYLDFVAQLAHARKALLTRYPL